MPQPNLNPEILAAALQGLEAQRSRLDAVITRVKAMLGARPQQPAATAEAPTRKRTMSAAGRRHIKDALKKRWAEYHRQHAEAATKAKEPAVAAKAPRPKRKISAAARKLMAEAARKRWAEYRRTKTETEKKAK